LRELGEDAKGVGIERIIQQRQLRPGADLLAGDPISLCVASGLVRRFSPSQQFASV
jgi:hypothetical protein